VHLVPRSFSCLRPWLDQLSPSYAPESHLCNVHLTCDVHYVSVIQFLDHHICSLVLNPIGFTLSTCSTLSTLVSPLIELSSKHQNSQESFHLSIPLAGGMPVYSASRRHAHAVTCTIFIIARTYQGSYRCVSTLRGLRKSGRQKISQASHALVAPCISSIMSPDPHVGAQQPCTCLP
jgi:hypothetical protein